MGFPSNDIEFIFFGIIALLMAFLFVFRKWISYLYCPLEKYEGKYLGKSGYTFITHLFISFFITISSFIFILNTFSLIDYFNNKPEFRILTFICLFVFVFLIVGLVIDKYLTMTDNVYRDWKIKKNNHEKAANSKS